jgi:hypothetical protein
MSGEKVEELADIALIGFGDMRFSAPINPSQRTISAVTSGAALSVLMADRVAPFSSPFLKRAESA